MFNLGLATSVFVCALPLLSLSGLLVQARRPLWDEGSIGKRDTVPALPSWIWLPVPDLGTSAPAQENATAAQFVTADNNFALWTNGQPIGATIPGESWKNVQTLNAQLNDSTNTFSVLAANFPGTAGGNAAGLLASIEILYSDGTDDTVVSDSSWIVSGSIPSDFPLPADLSAFVPVEVAGTYGSGIWGTNVTLDPPLSVLDLFGASWIWSTSNASANTPAGTVGFHQTVTVPEGKTASWASVLLSVDNSFNLYIDSQFVGAPPHDDNALNTTPRAEPRGDVDVVFTVFAENLEPQAPGRTTPAGVIGAIQVFYTDGSSVELVYTDETWLTGPFTTVAAFLATPDSELGPAFALGPYRMDPWGQLGVSNALDAIVVYIPGEDAVSQSPTVTSATFTNPLGSSVSPNSLTSAPTGSASTTSNSTSGGSLGSAGARVSLDFTPILVLASLVLFMVV
ncbi:hypothetical protein DFH07DRAFT_833353 [Mycena maculata]|uniref:Uncharacterized protein n=1 Tax=Mycena maculata TaxID=230809 RepID=A0AAD7IPA5_9AGAR|nr:hypothetical protein DFH07DRAFT_833353 [Mycena maculata]